MLELRNVTIKYGPVIAVKDLSLLVKENTITVLLGANGAGKTSVLMAIAGINKISSGEIFFNGERIDLLPAYEIVRRRLILCPESKLIFQNMTVFENLKAGAYTRKDDLKADLDYIFSLFPRLKERLKQIAGTLSGGERQMLAIARALMAKPKFLMLDEPSMGLAPNLVKEMMKSIQMIHQNGTTILLVEQNAYSALKIADYVYLLQTGKIVIQSKANELIKDKKIVEGYLGG